LKLSYNTFNKNSAPYGGAVTSALNPVESIKNLFVNNTADRGGVLYTTDSAAYVYGDVFVTNTATLVSFPHYVPFPLQTFFMPFWPDIQSYFHFC
jgi:hypothetical protein